MGKDIQKNALPTLFHFVRVRAAYQPHVSELVHPVAATAASSSFLLDDGPLLLLLCIVVNSR